MEVPQVLYGHNHRFLYYHVLDAFFFNCPISALNNYELRYTILYEKG